MIIDKVYKLFLRHCFIDFVKIKRVLALQEVNKIQASIV